MVDVREEYQVISYGIPAEAVDSGVEARCYSAEFEQIDTAWQISVEDEGKYAIIFANCLAEQGLDTTGTRLEKENRLAAAGITVDECLDSQE